MIQYHYDIIPFSTTSGQLESTITSMTTIATTLSYKFTERNCSFSINNKLCRYDGHFCFYPYCRYTSVKLEMFKGLAITLRPLSRNVMVYDEKNPILRWTCIGVHSWNNGSPRKEPKHDDWFYFHNDSKDLNHKTLDKRAFKTSKRIEDAIKRNPRDACRWRLE